MNDKQSDDQFIEEIAERMARAIKRSFTMDYVTHKPKKKKPRRPRKRKSTLRQ
jgi:hypothetical protein